MYRLLLYCCLIFFLISCRKGDFPKHVLIKGRLLQSSSNPVPVANYKLSFYQLGSNAILFGTSSSSADAVTNTDGYFECNFPLGSGYLTVAPTRNYSDISISGENNNGIQLYWGNVSARDTDVANIYLYKKVHKAIVAISPLADVSSSDTIFISAPTLTGDYNKAVTGLSIPQNTMVTVDTITDVIFTALSFETKLYGDFISVKRNSNSFSINGDLETMMDEDEKNT